MSAAFDKERIPSNHRIHHPHPRSIQPCHSGARVRDVRTRETEKEGKMPLYGETVWTLRCKVDADLTVREARYLGMRIRGARGWGREKRKERRGGVGLCWHVTKRGRASL